jgi:hypothetical protein
VDRSPQRTGRDVRGRAARTTWAEILFLAERLCPEPALVPADAEQRVACFGIAQELMGESGFGWCRRLMSLRAAMGDSDSVPEVMRPMIGRLVKQYGYSRAAADEAPERVAGIIELLSRRLAAQTRGGQALPRRRPALGGRHLLGCDGRARGASARRRVSDARGDAQDVRDPGPRVLAALDPGVLEHRDRIYREHMEFPLVL